MQIDVEWYDEAQHILLWLVEESWTIDDFYEAFEETQHLTQPLKGAASVIVDARRVTGRPRDNLIAHFRYALTHANLRHVVYLRDQSGGLFIQMLVNAVFHIYPHIGVDHFHFARTFDEALALITTPDTDDTDDD
jgi:hypothetical protein